MFKYALLALGLVCAALAHPVPAHAMMDNAPCDIRGCEGGGWNGVPGPGPSDPDLNGIPLSSGGDNRNFKAADKRLDKLDQKNSQTKSPTTMTPLQHQNTRALGGVSPTLRYCAGCRRL